MDKFYVIKLISKSGERGYLIDSEKGILVANQLVCDITQFKTYQDAQTFLRERKIERGGVKAYIRDNEDMMKDNDIKGGTVLEKDVYYLENELGHKCFYDSKHKGYYFDSPDVGYCCWETEKQMQDFIDAMKFEEKVIIKILKANGKN